VRYHQPEKRGGCYELYERIKQRNWPCRGELPDRNEQGCYIIARKGVITVGAEDLDGLTLPFAWSMLPKLRTGYLVEFTDDSMVISSEPPEGATDNELARLLWRHTENALDRVWEHRAGVQALAESHRQPKDWQRVIRPTPTPPRGARQCVARFGPDGERQMVWTNDTRRIGRYNEAAARLRRALANAPKPEPDDFDSSMARLAAQEREIERHPHIRLMRFLERVGDILG
jgi:hypothetical protein